jgi:uncharacterized surface protein with fasciclin (FAS1) repeats
LPLAAFTAEVAQKDQTMRAWKLSALTGLSALALAGCNNSNDEATATSAVESSVVQDETVAADGTVAESADGNQNIVALAQDNPRTSTLVSVITQSGLAETLSGPGPFTVFAPNNEAFEKLDQKTRDELMKPENKARLQGILKYHVVEGNLKSPDLANQIASSNGAVNLKTLNGGNLRLSMVGDKITLTDAKGTRSTVTIPDLVASNGTMHAVDTIVMP